MAPKITVQDVQVTITAKNNDDYICITDMAKARSDENRAADIIKNWIRSRSTLEFLGTWEMLYNPQFNVAEYDNLKIQAGLPTFTLSVGEWITKTNAIGISVERGRYGGTYAHKDIAFEFGSAISPTFKLYLLKEYQRLKQEENDPERIEWNAKRFLTKTNYIIQTDAVKNYIIPQLSATSTTEWLAYANEADLLNMALFGFTAKQWREANPELAKSSNVRDYASVNELAILANLQSHNAELIRQNVSKEERFRRLKDTANYQRRVLEEANKIQTDTRKLIS